MISITETTEPTTLPADLQKPFAERYQTMGLQNFRAYKQIFAAIRSGEITEENEDIFIGVLAESRTEAQRSIDKSFFDPLLKKHSFYTREHFNSHLEDVINKLDNSTSAISVRSNACLMIDLDSFKPANDTYGHKWGDQVLLFVAGVIKKHIRRDQDFVGRQITEKEAALNPKLTKNRIGRYGGDELNALLYDVDEQGAMTVAEAIRKELEESPMKAPDDNNWRQTVSIGVCLLKPDLTAQEVIERADTAAYNAKANGRNQVLVWKEGMEMPERQEVSTDLAEAA